MSGRQSSRATGRATADTTAAGGLKAAQDQIRALLADKATYKREAAAATKAAQKAAEKATREAVASAIFIIETEQGTHNPKKTPLNFLVCSWAELR